MRTLLVYVLVIPLSFVVSRLGMFVVVAPIAFALIKTSVQFRSTIGGFIGGVACYIIAVAFGWCVFNWVVGAGSFTFLPFLSSILILILVIPKNLREAQADAQLKKEFKEKGSLFAAEQMGNRWSTFVGEICGLIMVAAWFFLT